MVSFKRAGEGQTLETPLERFGVLHPGDPNRFVLQLELDFVARSDPETIAHGLGDYDLTLWANPASHTWKYNLQIAPVAKVGDPADHK
jgi:hypothetical protein